MVTRAPRRRVAVHRNATARPPITTQIIRVAVSPAAKTAYVVIGTAGLAALGIAIFGPRRFANQVVTPVRQAVGSQAEKLWSDAGPLRQQIGRLFEHAGSDREKLARNFQSWIGHFRAT